MVRGLFLLLYSLILSNLYGNNILVKKIFIGKNSGFISYRSSKLAMSLNVFGNQSEEKDFDLRLSGGSPFWLSYNGIELLPSFPNYTARITSAGTKIPLASTIGYVYDTVRSRKVYSPNNLGFLPYLRRGNSIFCFSNTTRFEYEKPNPDNLIISFEGRLKKFRAGFIEVLFKSIKWALFSWFSPNRSRDRQYLISDTNIQFKRKMLIGEEFLYLNDRISETGESRYSHCPFTFRSKDDFNNCEEEEDFFKVTSSKSSLVICISRLENEQMILKRALSSSTGIANYWEIKNLEATTELESHRLIIVTENDGSALVKERFVACRNKTLEVLNQAVYSAKSPLGKK